MRAKPIVTSSLLIDFPSPSAPVSLLLEPLRKRFVFHFCGNKDTNRPDKPEWMFSQILTWIKDHELFLMEWVQPVYRGFTNSVKVRSELLFVDEFWSDEAFIFCICYLGRVHERSHQASHWKITFRFAATTIRRWAVYSHFRWNLRFPSWTNRTLRISYVPSLCSISSHASSNIRQVDQYGTQVYVDYFAHISLSCQPSY